MKTESAKFEPQKRKWIVVDAENLALGRLASQIAVRIRGKHLPTFTPHVDLGDFVVVVNADKIQLTGGKWDKKTYYHYSGYMGGMKETTARKLNQRHPERMIRLAVWGMLPKNRLGRQLIKKLKVYTGPDHPHEAQQPEVFKPIEKYSS
ncbi:MAG: 50S ribosomal protein L13 [Syntrophobacteraceae bacterium]|nr:50S ribosomal protein L13 [Syntrophobacteraceae bacterium]